MAMAMAPAALVVEKRRAGAGGSAGSGGKGLIAREVLAMLAPAAVVVVVEVVPAGSVTAACRLAGLRLIGWLVGWLVDWFSVPCVWGTAQKRVGPTRRERRRGVCR